MAHDVVTIPSVVEPGVAYTAVLLDVGNSSLMLYCSTYDERSGRQSIECMAYDGLVEGITGARSA